jgi:hypothetical protein
LAWAAIPLANRPSGVEVGEELPELLVDLTDAKGDALRLLDQRADLLHPRD